MGAEGTLAYTSANLTKQPLGQDALYGTSKESCHDLILLK